MASLGLGHYVVVVLHVGGSSSSFYNVNRVLVKLGSQLVQFCLTKSVSMLMFVSCTKKLALF
jgi:hypothetical protein